MNDIIEQVDHSLLLWINGLHTDFLDQFFWIVSAKITWIPLYLLLFYLIYRKYNLKIAVIISMCLLGGVLLCDATSAFLIKEQVQRLRPSHHALLSLKLHYYEISPGHWYQGGQYGFVSSHATNFMALAVGFRLWMGKHYPNVFWILLLIAMLIAGSRVYLGVHYPTDILGGFVLGSMLMSLWYYLIWQKWLRGIVFEQE